MSEDWQTKYGTRRVRRDPPTLEEAIFAAAGITEDHEQQAEIAAALMGMEIEPVLAEVTKTTRLAEVMTSHPQTVDPDKPLGHALHMMYEGGFRNVPVVERGRLIGIVSARPALGPERKQVGAEMDERQPVTASMTP